MNIQDIKKDNQLKVSFLDDRFNEETLYDCVVGEVTKYICGVNIDLMVTRVPFLHVTLFISLSEYVKGSPILVDEKGVKYRLWDSEGDYYRYKIAQYKKLAEDCLDKKRYFEELAR